MKPKFFTEELLDLLQKQSFYAGKLSTITEVDEAVSLVYLEEESAVLGEPVYYHSDKGQIIIETYKQNDWFKRDVKRLIDSSNKTKSIIKANSYCFGRLSISNGDIRDFGITPKGIQGHMHERILETIAREENIEYEDIMSMLDICKRLGLIAQLNELNNQDNINLPAIEEMMYSECVEVEQRLKYSEQYDLAHDIYIYSDLKLDSYSDIIEAAVSMDEHFGKEVDALDNNSKVKKLTK